MANFSINAEAVTYAFHVKQRGRYTVDLEVFRKLAGSNNPNFPDGRVNRVRIAELPSVWPADALREKALEGGRLFLRAMAAQGLEPLTELEGLTVVGPYHHRRFDSSGATVQARRDGEDIDEGAADFVLEGSFIDKRGRRIETK